MRGVGQGQLFVKKRGPAKLVNTSQGWRFTGLYVLNSLTYGTQSLALYIQEAKKNEMTSFVLMLYVCNAQLLA